MTLTTKHQRLTALRPLSPESVASLAAAWDVRMVYESNSIEGNSLTRREANEVLNDFARAKASGKPIKDYENTIELGKAWRIVRSEAKPGVELNEPILLKIYGAFSDSEDRTLSGALLRSGSLAIQQSLGGGEFPFREPEYLGDLFLGIESTENRVEAAARLHERVRRHLRFKAHSGRAARLAMNFVLLAAGYPPVSIPTDLRQAYYSALEAADAGDFQTWLNFLTEQLNHELDEWLTALDPTFSADP